MLEKHGHVVWENSGWLIVHRKADASEAVLVPAVATDGDLPSDTNVPSGAAAAEPARTSL